MKHSFTKGQSWVLEPQLNPMVYSHPGQQSYKGCRDTWWLHPQIWSKQTCVFINHSFLGEQGWGGGYIQRPIDTFGCLAREHKSTYMPCLSTCRSHSEPSVKDRPQNSHGKRFSGALLSGNIMGSEKRQHRPSTQKCQGRRGLLWPYPGTLCCASHSREAKRLSCRITEEMKLPRRKVTLKVTNPILGLKASLQGRVTSY